jgi:hypothetical protein
MQVCASTVRLRAKEWGIKKCVAVAELLKKHHRKLRVQWCRSRRKTDFSTWIFSDESSFELSDCSASRHQKVFRAKNEKYAECCILQSGTTQRRQLMIWGCITSIGKCAFTVVEGTINATKYQEVLQTTLLPLLDEMPLSFTSRCIFQQDNASPHRAASTKHFMRENGITTTEWPALSPDLNPIENVWGLLKQYVRERGPKTFEELEKFVREAITVVVTPQLCNSLFSSMNSRVERVLCNKGRR